jgi:hypothetical protein
MCEGNAREEENQEESQRENNLFHKLLSVQGLSKRMVAPVRGASGPIFWPFPWDREAVGVYFSGLRGKKNV